MKALPFAVLLGVALVYAPSLSGDWVWDDVYQYAENPAITDAWTLVTHDVWEPTGHKDPENTPIYRPLAMLTHVPGQLWWTGPLVERVLNLTLHLVVVLGIAGVARAAGADSRAAWWSAALFGVHPAATEGVAWISSRGELLGTACLLGAAWALLAERRRVALAALLLFVAPFCKETFVLAPVSLVCWMLGTRRFEAGALAGALAGVVAYFGIRSGLGIGLPADGGMTGLVEGFGAVGAVAGRALELALRPDAPDALAPFGSRPLLGAVMAALVAATLPWIRGRVGLALLVSGLPLLAPAAPASLANGIVADRYFYTALALAAAALGVAVERHFVVPRPAPRLATALALVLALAPFTTLRALAWTSNARLFSAALERHPDSARAQFHLGYDFHVRQGDCQAAAALYFAAQEESPRAANNLLACWLQLGRHESVARLGPLVAERTPENPNPAANTARAFSALGDQETAERWIREALRRGEPRAMHLALLGNVLGLQGRHREALASFEAALARDPADADARRGVAIARRELERGGDT